MIKGKELVLKWIAPLWPALAGALLSLGVVLPVLHSLGVAAFGSAISASFAVGALCGVASVFSKRRRIVYAFGALLALLYAFSSGLVARLPDMLGAVLSLAGGNGEALRAFAPEAALLAGGILSLLGFSLARQSAGFYPALSLTMVAVLAVWFSGVRDGIVYFLPALFVLLSLFSQLTRDGAPPPRTIAVAALVVAASLLLSSSSEVSSRQFELFAEKLRNYITDTFFFTEPRTVYSIQADGFKPLETQLGGPVEAQERPVMTVRAPRAMLLRGAIYNHYNGLSWFDTLSTRRYLFADFRNRGNRANTFDENRPSAAVRDDGTFELLPVQITMQAGSASTLFAPLRSEQLKTPMELVPYFNASSELFITRDLAAGDEYSLYAPVVALDDVRLPGQIAAAAAERENRDMNDYLHVPEVVASEVLELALRVTQNASTPLEKALALRDHLRRGYAYTLTPDVPPANQDFVSHFLLREKKGYCTYFASAMAVMGRMVGIPTRYVEGYLAEPSGGTALVTSKNAHAWAELYFDGFGWVSFDATPPHSSGSGRQNGEGSEQDAQQGGQGDEETPMDEQEAPPPDENPEDEDPEGDNSEEDDSADDSSTPPPDPTPTPDPTPEPDIDPFPTNATEPPTKKSPFWRWFLLFLILAATCAREYWTRPGTVAGQKGKTDKARLMAWYRALLGILSASGVAPLPSESPAALAARALERFPGAESGLTRFAGLLTAQGYGRDETTPADVSAASACYRAVFRLAPLKGKIVWTARRIVLGIGNLERVP